jgi:hypothetical protein
MLDNTNRFNREFSFVVTPSTLLDIQFPCRLTIYTLMALLGVMLWNRTIASWLAVWRMPPRKIHEALKALPKTCSHNFQ